jgi:RNA polymerase sigma-70 factor, ECF subfamily
VLLALDLRMLSRQAQEMETPVTYSLQSANCAGLPAENSAHFYGRRRGAVPRRSRAFLSEETQRPGDAQQDYRQEFDEMFSASRQRFVSMAYAILHNEADAEDAVQNACLSACVHLRSFEGRSALKTWFTRIVLNAALMLRRRRKGAFIIGYPETNETDGTSWPDKIRTPRPDPEDTYATGESLELIDSALSRLKPVLRQAFTMTYCDEMSSREACTTLRISPSTFKARLFRAKKQLFQQLDRNLVPPERRVLPGMALARRVSFRPIVHTSAERPLLELAS